MEYHGCGLWWWSFICCGADMNEVVDFEERGYVEEVCKQCNQPYPPHGREREYDVDKDVPKCPLPDDLLSHHFNIQVMFYRMRIYKLLEFVQRSYVLYMCLQVGIHNFHSSEIILFSSRAYVRPSFTSSARLGLDCLYHSLPLDSYSLRTRANGRPDSC